MSSTRLLCPLLALFLAAALSACDTMSSDEPEVEITDLVEGTGTRAVKGMTVSVYYVGWREDGTVFDTNREDEEPFSFVLGAGDVIDGWDQGIQGMRVGGKRQLRIPPELAYGQRGICYPQGCVISPNATLNFEVDLVDAVAP